jgi:phytoene dehydrogenase-like protein
VGGGIGGVTAAIAAAEAGWAVTLLEARSSLGGRARTSDAPFRANWGPHVVYQDGPMWRWLAARGLAEPAAHPPKVMNIVFRVDGARHHVPPIALIRALHRVNNSDAPVERTFFEWATNLVGGTQARRLANFAGVATFDHDPGRLSAAFVRERIRRATVFPPTTRYIPGGWATLATRMADHARLLGVEIETGARVDTVPEPPVVLAVPLAAARAITGDSTLRPTGTRTALLDVGLAGGRRPPFAVSDLDGSGWVETFSIPDPSVAPPGHHLLQAQAGMRDGEHLDDAIARLETLLDVGIPDWRNREVWRRRARVENESGALDLPGTTWSDRPAIDRGDGVFLVGDMVAAPGVLAEVSHEAACRAIAGLAARSDEPQTARSAPAGTR